MPHEHAGSYGFRALTEEDFPLLRRWLSEPHMAEWWGEPEEEMQSFAEAITSRSTKPMIVSFEDKPIAYFQTYDIHLEDDHPYRDQPEGTLGIDLSIGPCDFIGKGHGSAMLRQFVEALSASVPRVVIDPHPDNARAIRAYGKAGFRHLDTRDTPFGLSYLMGRDLTKETSEQ